MKISEEIIKYCKIDNPAGALLLTGEWGSGKTYFVENDLKSDDMFFVRVSLFGISTVEEMNNAVKRAWVNIKGGTEKAIVKTQNIKTVLETIKNFFPDGFAKNVYGTVLSISFLDLIKIERTYNGKKVILIFDDFERNELSVKEKLGAINDYCENKKINVIILADEGRVEDESYKEFKEKVIMHTIRFIPDYRKSVESVIKSTFKGSYKDFLIDYLNDLVALFSGIDANGNAIDELSEERIEKYIFPRSIDEDKERNKKFELIRCRTHNLRVLKASLQDFERIYRILDEHNAKDINRWCYSFVSYSMASKANLISDHGEMDSFYTTQDIGILYPGFFDMRFFHDSISTLVNEGMLDEEAFNSCVVERNKYSDDSSPKDKVKACRIDYLNENIAIIGMNDILPDAYAGRLSLEEYVQFIANSRLVREYDLCELEIDWKKVIRGIEKRINDNVELGVLDSYDHIIDDLNGYSDGEKNAYRIIKNIRDSSGIIMERNRREYLKIMRESPAEAFILLSGKRYSFFNEEMADVTFDAFCEADNSIKAQFPGYFFGLWREYPYVNSNNRENIEKTKNGLRRLENRLVELKERYGKEPFKKRYTVAFIQQVEKLLNHYN